MTEELYEKHKNIIYNQAWHGCRLSGAPLEDLLSLGNEVFMKAIGSWKPKRSSFSSWLWTLLGREFSDYLNRTDVPVDQDRTEMQTEADDPSRLCGFMEMIDGFSRETGYVATMILEGPAEALKLIGGENPRDVRGALRRHLLEIGWTHAQIWRSFQEIREALRC